jgi:hypothetical protein
MTSQQQLVCDSSTLANFKQWAQAISTFFSTAGWTQSSDTGQVNWSSIGAVPGSGAFVYEVWRPNDGLTNFYLKIEYGNVSGTNCPSLRFSVSTTTDGAGTLTGIVLGPLNTNNAGYTPSSAVTQYECNFSGAAGRMGVMLWRNNATGNNCQQFFAVERSLNASGAATGTYVTVWTCGFSKGSSQQTLVFGVGVTELNNSAGNGKGWVTRVWNPPSGSTAFNGAIPFDACSPMIGYFDYPSTVCGAAFGLDITDGVTFTVTLYGSTRTYMPGKNGPFGQASIGNNTSVVTVALCMRYD